MSVRVAINGFGRIGRNVLRASIGDSNIEITNINDITDPATLAHLLKYDSVFGVLEAEVKAQDDAIMVNGRRIKVSSQREPKNLPWGEDGIDVALECTGLFTKREKAAGHLEAGAKKVIISAPAKDEDITVCMGVNNEKYEPSEHNIISNASCTTNCLSPVAKVLQDNFGIVRGLMTTVHSYTNDQKILDLPHADLRRGRAAALSMIPTSTGAAKAVSLVLPELKGKLDGMAIRVPVPAVSVVDLVCEIATDVSVEDVNRVMKEASETNLKGVLEYLDVPCVSVDFKKNPHSSIFDSAMTKVMGGNMVKVLSWYDNEWGFSCRMRDLINYIDSRGL